jgi:hypothetical protein
VEYQNAVTAVQGIFSRSSLIMSHKHVWVKLIHFMPFSFCSGMWDILCPLVTFWWSWKVISKCPASTDMGTLLATVIFITSYLLNCHASCMDFVAIVYRKSHIYLLHQHYVYHAFSCTAIFGWCVSFISHCWRTTFIRLQSSGL